MPAAGPALRDIYNSRVESGALQHSDAQAAALDALDDVRRAVVAADRTQLGFFGRLFGAKPDAAPRGLYLWGGVGRGKTMLMDLFFENLPIKQKRRIHFHEFMADVHDRIGVARKQFPGDPIPIVAKQIASDAKVLAFDEIHVTDIADAMILGRLFRALFESRVTVVSTSNVPPEGLYKNGLNRDLFLPFIELIGAHMDVHAIADGADYRLEKLVGQALYFVPLTTETDRAIQLLWLEFTNGFACGAQKVRSLGRTIEVPRGCEGHAWFSFAELCDSPLGARDYLAIAKRYHTVFLVDVPELGPEKRNAARRFINLVDTFYDLHVCLVITAEAEPKAIYQAGDGVELFERTISRLMEMRSAAYLANRQARIEAVEKAEIDKAASVEPAAIVG
ncbi:MAG: cell division protein ZapE [Pseudomonadota bacterium]